MVSVIGQGNWIPAWSGLPGGVMLQQVKWKLTRPFYSIVGRDPPTRPQDDVAPRPRPTIRFLGQDWGRFELIRWVALCILPTLVVIFVSMTSEQTQMKFWSIIVLLLIGFCGFLPVVL